MTRSIDVFMLRHAVPLDNGLDDPGIEDGQIAHIKDAAEIMAGMAEESTEFTVYVSPRQAAVQSGTVLQYSDALAMSRGVHPTPYDGLSDQYDPSDQESIRERWPSMLRAMGGQAMMRTATDKNTGLIIVTHEPVMRAFPDSGLVPDTDHLAINHFKDYPEPLLDKTQQTSRRTDHFIKNARALQDKVREFLDIYPEALDEGHELTQKQKDLWDALSKDLQERNRMDVAHFLKSKE